MYNSVYQPPPQKKNQRKEEKKERKTLGNIAKQDKNALQAKKTKLRITQSKMFSVL